MKERNRKYKKMLLAMEGITVIITRLLFLFLVVYYFNLLEYTEELKGFLIALTFSIVCWGIPIRKIIGY